MHRCRPPILATAMAVAALSLLVAACGSSSPRSASASGSGGEPTQAQVQQDVVSFTDCMRSHGVSSFPDPGTPGFKGQLAPGTAHSPAFLAALAVCRHHLPNNGAPGDAAHSPAQIAAFLAFARCLRSHGFPTFPDPTTTGQLTHQMVASAGINLHQPAVLQAGDACVGVTDGVITKVAVARFISGQ